MKYYYRTRDSPQLPFKFTIPEERREQLINTIKKVIVMPVTVRLNHAIADGYLVANVFRLLEQEIRCFVGL